MLFTLILVIAIVTADHGGVPTGIMAEGRDNTYKSTFLVFPLPHSGGLYPNCDSMGVVVSPAHFSSLDDLFRVMPIIRSFHIEQCDAPEDTCYFFMSACNKKVGNLYSEILQESHLPRAPNVVHCKEGTSFAVNLQDENIDTATLSAAMQKGILHTLLDATNSSYDAVAFTSSNIDKVDDPFAVTMDTRILHFGSAPVAMLAAANDRIGAYMKVKDAETHIRIESKERV